MGKIYLALVFLMLGITHLSPAEDVKRATGKPPVKKEWSQPVTSKPAAPTKTSKNTTLAEERKIFGYRPLDWQLIEAVRESNLERVKALIAQGADVNAGGDLGHTPIYNVIIFESEKQQNTKHKMAVLDYLFSKGADVRKKTAKGYGILHNCVNQLSPAYVFEYFVKKGADINEVNESGETVLYTAQNRGLLEYVKLLKSRNALSSNGRIAKSVLEAVEFNDQAALQKLIAEGKDVNEKDAYFTPLSRAVREKKLEMASYLLEHGAKESLTAEVVQDAVRNGQLDMLKLFVKHGMVVKDMKPSPLFSVWVLSVTRTPEHFEVLKYLLVQGADVNARTEEGVTLLYEAAIGSNKVPREYIRYAIEKGANVNALLGGDVSPLSMCMDFDGNPWMAGYLLQKGANPKIGNNKALFVLSRGPGNVTLAKLLARYGADLKALDEQGNSALHMAASGYAGVAYVKYLVSKGVKINLKNQAGETPYQLALKRTRPGVEGIRKYLKSMGAK